MLKRFFCTLFAIIVLTFGTTNRPASATDGSIIIDNILDLCQNMLAHGYSLDNTRTCDAYSRAQTSVSNIDKIIYISDNVVLKNLDLTFTFSYTPFIINEGGSLTIDGGHYSSPSCVIWIQYDNGVNPGYYVPSTSITINSGVFEASLLNRESAEAPSPVCLISRYKLTTEEAATVIANYLPTNHRFINLGTRSAEDAISVSEGDAHISKSYEVTDTVDYLQTTAVAVVEDEGLGSEDLVEEEPAEPQSPDKYEEKEEDSEDYQDAINLPKAPNSGMSHAKKRNIQTEEITLMTVIFTIVIFTTYIWGHYRKNR